VAWVPRDPDAAALALARDVTPFDQRGCLSPRIVLIRGDADAARAFARGLDAALADEATRVPRGSLTPEEEAEKSRYAAALAYAGDLHDRPTHTIGVAPHGATLLVPPAGRHVHVAAVWDDADAAALLAPLQSFVTAVGVLDAAGAPAWLPRHARLLPVGRMQRPPFDGPVDRRP
jgi:hypothetical protein